MRQEHRLYYKGNRFQQMRAFCQAASLGSFRKAAHSLFLNQPTLSLRIQALERELGVRLFDRRPSGVKLTPEGEIFLDLAKPLMDGMDSLSEEFDQRRGVSTQDIILVAASQFTIDRVLPDIFISYLKKFPNVRLRVFGGIISEVAKLVLDEQVDLGFGPDYQLPGDLEFIPCINYGTVVITNHEHPFAGRRRLRVHEVAEQPLVLFAPNSLQNTVITEWVEAHHLKPRIVIEASGWDVVRRCVELGLGIGIVSEGWIDDETRLRLNVIPFSEYLGTRTYGVMLKRGKHLSLASRRLVAEIEQAFG